MREIVGRSYNNLRKTFGLLNRHGKIIIFDTETCGLEPDAQVIQFSGILFQIRFRQDWTSDPDKGEYFTMEELERYNCYIKPYKPVSEKITEITGISNQFLEDYPYEDLCFPDIDQFLSKSGGLLAGYNVRFDLLKIAGMYGRNGKPLPAFESMDVLEMSRDLLKKGQDLENYKLGTVAQVLGADAGLRFHSSMDDAEATARVFKAFLADYMDVFLQVSKPGYKDKKENARPLYAYYWENPHQKSMRRVIAKTSLGDTVKPFYDTLDKRWCLPASSKIKVGDIDIDGLENRLLAMYRCQDMEALCLKLKDKAKEREKRKEEEAGKVPA